VWYFTWLKSIAAPQFSARASRSGDKLRAGGVRRSGLFIGAVLCAAFGGAAFAANVPGLYEAVVVPTDKPRDSAFVEALRQVAVRVSGSRDAGDRVMTVKPDARRYVRQFSFKDDGAAAVTFDPASFDQLLTSAGLPIWGRERPAVLVWLMAPDAAGRPAWLGVADTGVQRDAVVNAALARGVPLIWPSMDATDQATAAALGASVRSYDQLMASAERYRADAVLVGTPIRDAGGSTVRWTFAFNGEAAEFNGSLDEGINAAADRCAQLLAVAAGVRGAVALQIFGIRDLDAYARTLNYLEGLTIVRSVAVEKLQADRLDLQLAVRGDANALKRTIGLGKRLLPLDGATPATPDAGERLRYQFQP
jgi:hypothetical protein